MYDGIVQDLIDEFGRLPGIGPKSAQRIAFHILQTPNFDVSHLAELLSVDDVRDEPDATDRFQHRPAEEGEPLGVVRVVGLVAAGHRLLVEPPAGGRVVAVEVLGVLDEVNRHVGPR